MNLHLRIHNNSGSKLDLTKASLTYRFSDNSSLDKFAYDIWWFSNGNASDAKISFNEINSREKSFRLYFSAGEVQNGGHAEIQLRVRKTDWSFFSMIGDYSLPVSGTEWAMNPNIALSVSSHGVDFPIQPPDWQSGSAIALLGFSDMLLGLSDYSVFGANEVRLADRVSDNAGRIEIHGSVGIGSYAEIGADSRITGSLHSRKNAFLRERAQLLGNLRVGENYTAQNFVLIEGEKLAGKPIPDFKLPSEKDLKAGTSDVFVGNHEAMHLEPGAYRDFTAHANSALYLKPGKYSFRNFRLEPEASLNIDVSSGVVEIYALETATFSDRVAVSYAGDYSNPLALRVYQHGSSDLRIGTDLSIGGYFIAPNASIRVSSRVMLAGWLHGKNIYVEPDTKICEPPTLSGLTHSGIAYAPYFNALNPEYRTAKTGDLEVFAKAKDNNSAVGISRDGNRFRIKLHNPGKASVHPLCARTEYFLAAGNGGDSVVYVKGNSECSGNSCDGTGWGKAFKSLQKGVEAAKTEGKAVWLAEGNYEASGDSVLRLGMGTEIRGSFGSGASLEDRGGDINKTVVKGNGENALLFLGGSGLPYAAHMDMATVTDGNILSAYAAPALDYLVIKDNDIWAEGGGVYSLGSDGLKISNSYIANNKSVSGGGLFVKGGSLALENTIVSANKAGNGAAVYAENARLKIRHATIADNQASAGKGVAFAGSVNAEAANSIVWNNGGSDLAAASENPLFKSNAAAGEDGLFFTKDDGYALSDNSPMIDMGVKLPDIPVDIFQMDRSISKDGSGLPDMGAREWFFDVAKSFRFLKRTVNSGLQPVEKPTILKEDVGDYFPLRLAGSPYAYVFSAKMPKNKYMKSSHSGTVRILTEDGKKACGEAKNVTFYRIGEEDGMVEYRTYKKKGEGVYIFLARKEMPSHTWYRVLKVCEGAFRVEIEAYR
jgi:hypothetical protein